MRAKKYQVFAVVLIIWGCVILGANTRAIEPPKFPNDDSPEWIPERQPIYAETTSETLQGLEGVRVYVELRPIPRIGDLTEKMLQNNVESVLDQKGIKVFSAKDSVSVAGRSPKLHIVVGVARTKRYGGCGYSVTAGLWQWAELFREPRIFCSAVTWTDLKVGFSPIRKTEDTIKDATKELLDRFINDYLAANPKDKQDNITKL